jgi:lipopolysaccharide transport system permease protein
MSELAAGSARAAWDDAPAIVIAPPSERLRLDWREYVRYRQLFKALVWRDIRVQFDETSLGLLWTCVRPLMYVAVFVAFRNLSKANTHVQIPYPLYIYSGLILWYYVLEALTKATAALRRDASLLTKVYYPRLITPAVPVVATLVSVLVPLVPLAFMMAWYGVATSWRLLALPLVILQCMALVLGVGATFAALTLSSRDWENVLRNALYLGMFVSPVVYGPEMIPRAVQPVYYANPMAGTLLAFRSCLFAPEPFPVGQWAYAAAVSVLVLVLGIRIFRAAESQFADRL